MKTILILALVFNFGIAHAQKKAEIPVVVSQSFTAKYPNVKKFKTDYRKTEVDFKFKVDGKRKIETMSMEGEWIKTQEFLTVEELPSKVFSSVRKAHSNGDIGELVKITSPKETKFWIIVNYVDYFFELSYSPQGQLLSSIKKVHGQVDSKSSNKQNRNEESEPVNMIEE